MAAPRARPLMLSVTAVKRRGSFDLDVRFELPTPGVAALFGRSGCGKSTAVNVIAGLLGADPGRVVLDGTVLFDSARRINLPPEKRRIGYVFQDARLFPHMSVAANLRYAARRASGPAFVDLESVTRLLDLGSLMDRHSRQLSGGERQRVAVGRALLTQPRLLLLDEPLAGLDEARRAEVLPYLENLRDQLAIPMVYVTHDFQEVLRLATHIVLMEAGSVTAQGTVAQMTMDPRIRSIVGRDEIGASIEGTVFEVDPAAPWTEVQVGSGTLHVPTKGLVAGSVLRVHLLARDIIVSTQPPQHLSVRNSLAGVIVRIDSDDEHSDLVTIDVGGQRILARITQQSTVELRLCPGLPVWALVKSVSLRAHPFGRVTSAGSPGA